MIRLRDMIERGCRHRLLGPIVILALAVLLASVFLHVALEGAEAAVELGELCVAIATILGSFLLARSRGTSLARVGEVADRGPPRLAAVVATGLPGLAAPVAIPLRR